MRLLEFACFLCYGISPSAFHQSLVYLGGLGLTASLTCRFQYWGWVHLRVAIVTLVHTFFSKTLLNFLLIWTKSKTIK